MTDYNSDSDDSFDFDHWDNDGEAESSSALALRSPDAPGRSTLVPQGANDRAIGAATSDSFVQKFVRMGFREEMVLKGIKHLKGTDENELLNLLLAYQDNDGEAKSSSDLALRSPHAPLEPQDMEYLLGFPSGHTRGFTKMERYESLGNSFHVDTVAYHLSVLKEMFPNGMNVLSLFSGIGGGEIALHKLGIHMKTVISVEISQVSRDIFRNWWEETQSGTLVQINNAQSLTDETIKALIIKHGGFDLVIGGNACNYPTGSHRAEFDRNQAVLFYQYVRILKTVRSAMRRM